MKDQGTNVLVGTGGRDVGESSTEVSGVWEVEKEAMGFTQVGSQWRVVGA